MEKEKELIKIILKNKNIKDMLDAELFPDNISWYLSAGCIHQTVWNYLTGRDLEKNIKDYDLIYYDPRDLTKESEKKEASRINKLFSHLDIEIEVINEARVHLWPKNKLGKKIEQYKSCEESIDTWLTTVTTIGVTKRKGKIVVYSTYGLEDTFNITVRPNKAFNDRGYYEKKVNKWKENWPNLKIMPWEQ
jgi:hypothetical protein